MLESMRQLGLEQLYRLACPLSDNMPSDLDTWYYAQRAQNPQSLEPFFLEQIQDISRVYVIEPVSFGNSDKLQLTAMDLVNVQSEHHAGGCLRSSLPFIRPTAPNSPQIGPLLKRTPGNKVLPPGPKPATIRRTVESFADLANSSAVSGGDEPPWTDYFRELLKMLDVQELYVGPSVYSYPPPSTPDEQQKDMTYNLSRIAWVLNTAIDHIEDKATVLLTVRVNGLFLGDDQRYMAYLGDQALDPNKRYTIQKTPARLHQTCPLCSRSDVAIYPSAIKAAGLNFLNSDREGAFPDLEIADAYKRYAICAPCADLLMVFWHRLIRLKSPLVAFTGGDKALMLPFIDPAIDSEIRGELWDMIQDTQNRYDAMDQSENHMLDLLKDSPGVLGITWIWADFGQEMKDITGIISNVLPSQLGQLSIINKSINIDQNPAFPEMGQRLVLRLDYDLLRNLLWRPHHKSKSGDKTLRHMIVAAIYKRGPWPHAAWNDSILRTLRSFVDEATSPRMAKTLTSSYLSGKDKDPSGALWVRRLAHFLWLLKQPYVEVFPMTQSSYQPKWEPLQAYVGPQTGIDSPEKAYAFMVGAMFGKLLAHMSMRKVNVVSNGLSMLKRLTLQSGDLPELFTKIYQKFLIYNALGNEHLRALLEEFGRVATQLGEDIPLSQVQVAYYLMLGMAVAKDLLPRTADDS